MEVEGGGEEGTIIVPITFVKPFGVGRLCLDIVYWHLPYPKEGFGCGWVWVRMVEIWDRCRGKKADDDFIRREIDDLSKGHSGLNQATKTSYRTEGGNPGKNEIDRPGSYFRLTLGVVSSLLSFFRLFYVQFRA